MPSVYQQLAQQMQDVSGDKGVLKEVIRPGDGDKVPYDSTVIVKYSGYLEQAEKPFDTNCFRRYPRLMKLGEDITLAGMEIALLTMQRGELSRFLFSPSYAYGTLGCPPLIPRSATVLFEIELLDFLDTAESDSFCSLTLEQQATFPLDKVIKIAGTEREFGNYLFKRNRFDDAKERYKRALTVLARYTSSEEEMRHLNAARLYVYLNLSLTYLKKERPARALIWGEKALDIDSKNTKALYRCGLFEQHSPALNMESESSASSTSISPNSSDNESIVAHMDDMAYLEMREYEKARNFLLRAQKQEPYNLEINSELKRLESCYQDYMDKQREMCCRMFASSKATRH